MAGISRTTAVLFGTTGLTPTGGFGAAANGVLTTEAGSSNTVSNIQTGQSGLWAGGWLGAVLGASKFPAIEDMNAVDNVFSTQIAYILERGIPEYDAGTTYNTGDIARDVGLTTLYKSVGDANIGHALNNATYWTFLCDLANLASNYYNGGTTTGSANAQVLASVSPSGFSLSNNGATVVCTAGFTNSGSATINVSGTGATTIYKNSGSGPVVLTGSEIVAGATIFLTVNTGLPGFVLTTAPSVNLLQSVYPIGSIYIGTTSTNPNTLFGFGTWVAYAPGQVLIGVGSFTDGDSTSKTITGGQQLGEYNHTLSTGELPAHTHATVITRESGTAGGDADFLATGGSTVGSSSFTSSSVGSGTPHNVIQPSIGVYIWNRTA